MIREGLEFLISELQPLVLVVTDALQDSEYNVLLSQDIGLRTEIEFEIFEQEDDETFLISKDSVEILTELKSDILTYLVMVQGSTNNPVYGVATSNNTLALQVSNSPYTVNNKPVLVNTLEATVNSTGSNGSTLVINENILTVGEAYKVVDRTGSGLIVTPLPEVNLDKFLTNNARFFIRI